MHKVWKSERKPPAPPGCSASGLCLSEGQGSLSIAIRLRGMRPLAGKLMRSSCAQGSDRRPTPEKWAKLAEYRAHSAFCPAYIEEMLQRRPAPKPDESEVSDAETDLTADSESSYGSDKKVRSPTSNEATSLCRWFLLVQRTAFWRTA
eukprot:scaffold757_cov246-Pinguiococcus_pyrenoidosus.AAC.25